MIVGDWVRLKDSAPSRVQHPELAGAIGVVGSVQHGNGNALLHVRFGRPVNLVVLNAHAGQCKTADRLNPRLAGD